MADAILRKWRLFDTATPLGGGATFSWDSTSLQHGLTNAKSVIGTVIANQASAANGVKIEQSPDGTNWDLVSEQAAVANTAIELDDKIAQKHVRIRYTNGGVAQGSFRFAMYAEHEIA